MLLRRKSSGPKRREIRPQWLVRPPSIRARHQSNFVSGAVVYGSPSICHPPMQASNSPKGCVGVDAPRRGDSYAHRSMKPFRAALHAGPASSITTSAPAEDDVVRLPLARGAARVHEGRVLAVDRGGLTVRIRDVLIGVEHLDLV